MKPAVFSLFALVFLIGFHGSVSHSGQLKGKCMEEYFKCWMNSTTIEEFRNRQTSCCEKLLSNVTYSFTETLDTCVADEYEDLASVCFNAVGPICRKDMIEDAMKNLKTFAKFEETVLENIQPPADVQDCGRFATDYEAEAINLCRANNEEFECLKEMCDAVLSASGNSGTNN